MRSTARPLGLIIAVFVLSGCSQPRDGVLGLDMEDTQGARSTIEVDVALWRDFEGFDGCLDRVYNLNTARATGEITGNVVDTGATTDSGNHTGWVGWRTDKDGNYTRQCAMPGFSGRIAISGTIYGFRVETQEGGIVLDDGKTERVGAGTWEVCVGDLEDECTPNGTRSGTLVVHDGPR